MKPNMYNYMKIGTLICMHNNYADVLLVGHSIVSQNSDSVSIPNSAITACQSTVYHVPDTST